MRRILLLHPVIREELSEEGTKLMEYLARFLPEDFHLESTYIPYGPSSIETHYDAGVATLFVTKEVEKAAESGYDAVIINCFDDPGLRSAREAVKIPVIGPGRSSMYLACLLGDQFSILTVGKQKVITVPTPRIRKLGLSTRFASKITTDVKVREIHEDKEEVLEKLSTAGETAVNDHHADVLVLGCTLLWNIKNTLAQRLNVPVIFPGTVAAEMAKLLLNIDLSHSKGGYPNPLEKIRKYPSPI